MSDAIDRLHVVRSLRNLIEEAQTLLETTELPENQARRAHEALTSALALADDLIDRPVAATLGSKGGRKTAERGSEYYRTISGMRKKKAGGRPKNPD